MDLGISGKTALVLGAGGGLGSAIAQSLAREGVRVAACDIDANALARTVDGIAQAGGQARPYVLDLARADQFEPLLGRVRDELSAPAILVNNTGGPPPTTAAGVAAEQWRRQFEAMVVSVIQLTDLVLPAMREAGWGRIITSTSSGVVSPIPNLGMSNALRLSLVGWSKTLAAEVAPQGVTANIVLPGRIMTGRIQQLDEARAQREGKSVEQVRQASTQSIPARRYGRPDEYGDTVAFLASEQASYITGSVIRVDGGLIASI